MFYNKSTLITFEAEHDQKIGKGQKMTAKDILKENDIEKLRTLLRSLSDDQLDKLNHFVDSLEEESRCNSLHGRSSREIG